MFENVINTYSEIVNRFRHEVDANAVLVGGAIRDTHYGVEVKDLDFVVNDHTPDGRPWLPTNMAIAAIWPDKEFRWVDAGELAEQYPDIDHGPLIDVIESTDKTINIIIVTNIGAYTQGFPDSISEMVFDGTNVHTSSRWREGDENIAVYYDREKMKPARLEKLQRKYPTWHFEAE